MRCLCQCATQATSPTIPTDVEVFQGSDLQPSAPPRSSDRACSQSSTQGPGCGASSSQPGSRPRSRRGSSPRARPRGAGGAGAAWAGLGAGEDVRSRACCGCWAAGPRPTAVWHRHGEPRRAGGGGGCGPRCLARGRWRCPGGAGPRLGAQGAMDEGTNQSVDLVRPAARRRVHGCRLSQRAEG